MREARKAVQPMADPLHVEANRLYHVIEHIHVVMNSDFMAVEKVQKIRNILRKNTEVGLDYQIPRGELDDYRALLKAQRAKRAPTPESSHD